MKILHAFKPTKANDLFNFRMLALTTIAFLLHLGILYFSNHFYREGRPSNFSTFPAEMILPGIFLFFIYLIFVLIPARIIFLTKLPMVVKYALVIAIPMVIFHLLDAEREGLFNYAMYTLPLFCLFDLYGRIHKVCEEEPESV
ncbi:hypothetical protein [Salibacterium aidingense]|uniref:hypothetical protein n=1 Tax=Salibacterium aidingense TaxID=384933 RepID=UPI00040D0637|nr:hypothetical protein [Salibacterium aidingense]